jgi:hypothetical protein
MTTILSENNWAAQNIEVSLAVHLLDQDGAFWDVITVKLSKPITIHTASISLMNGDVALRGPGNADKFHYHIEYGSGKSDKIVCKYELVHKSQSEEVKSQYLKDIHRWRVDFTCEHKNKFFQVTKEFSPKRAGFGN